MDVAFDDPNLIADAGLVPVIALAEQVGLPGLVAEHVTIRGAANSAGANPGAKVMSLLAGMIEHVFLGRTPSTAPKVALKPTETRRPG